MKTVIMAGGMGTRIASVESGLPKPMISIGGHPVLEHQINCLRKQGLDDILLVIGHLGNIIQEYFKDGKRFGVSINYLYEREPLGTAGALFYLKNVLTEDFILLNGDIMLDVDFTRFIKFHQVKKAAASLFTHPNSHPYDSALIETDDLGKVIRWLHKEDIRGYCRNRVNAGIHILSPQLLTSLTAPKKIDLDRDILKPFVDSGRLYAYDSPEYVKDMGTPERYRIVCEDYRTGKIQAKNLQNKQKAVFLDRDGTINKYKGFITRAEDMELLSEAAEAVRIINESGYLVIVVSNQPMIARGGCIGEELKNIHNKMETDLGKAGAYIDDSYYCFHHTDKESAGEYAKYKDTCSYRKPKPEILLQAAEKYNIDLTQSYLVGDSYWDVEAGLEAGCMSIYIGQPDLEHPQICKVENFKNLLEFAREKMVD